MWARCPTSSCDSSYHNLDRVDLAIEAVGEEEPLVPPGAHNGDDLGGGADVREGEVVGNGA